MKWLYTIFYSLNERALQILHGISKFFFKKILFPFLNPFQYATQRGRGKRERQNLNSNQQDRNMSIEGNWVTIVSNDKDSGANKKGAEFVFHKEAVVS